MKRTTILIPLAALALCLGSCGGGSGGGGGAVVVGNATFSGSYILVQFSGLRSSMSPAAEDEVSNWGRVTSDGAGMVSGSTAENDNGVISPPGMPAAVAYSVAADGMLTIDAATGGVNSDGTAAVFMANVAGADPNMNCLLRTSGVNSNQTFSGNYHRGLIGGDTTFKLAIWSTSALGPLVANGAGGLTVPSSRSASGASVGFIGGGQISYAVSPDGTLAASSGLGSFQGGILPDGSFALGAGGTNAAEAPFMIAYVKYATAATQATFSGSYWAVGISSDPSSNDEFTSFIGTVTADGAGNMSFASTTENNEGTVSMITGADMYVISATGAMTTSSGAREGAITADGRYGYLCGDKLGDGPLLFLFIRK